MTTQELAPLLKIKDIAQRLNVGPETVRRMILRHELIAVRFAGSVRVRPDVFEAFLEERSGRAS